MSVRVTLVRRRTVDVEVDTNAELTVLRSVGWEIESIDDKYVMGYCEYCEAPIVGIEGVRSGGSFCLLCDNCARDMSGAFDLDCESGERRDN